MIPPDLRHEYTFEASVGGAGDGVIALLIVPLIGASIGALRGLFGEVGQEATGEPG